MVAGDAGKVRERLRWADFERDSEVWEARADAKECGFAKGCETRRQTDGGE